MKWILVFIFCVSGAYAQRFEEDLLEYDLPSTPSVSMVAQSGPEMIVRVSEGKLSDRTTIQLRGLVLVDCKEHLFKEEQLKEVDGIVISGVNLPASRKRLGQILDPIYCDQPLNSETIQKLQRAISAFFEDNYAPFVLVLVPPQDISFGVLQLIVVEGKAGEIDVQGNCWFTEQRIKSYVRTKSGDPIDLYSIERDLDMLNRNPFRRVNMIYSPGREFGTANLTFSVEDKNPWRVYVGADNTGIETMGRQRLFSGITLGNLFYKDHLLTYQYTTSYDFNKFQGHTAQYMAPLFWKHLINIYGGYSFVDPKLTFPSMRHRGKSSQVSFRYTIPLRAHPRSTQDLSLGFDYKNTNTTVTFSELYTVFGSSVNLTQAVLEYNAHREGTMSRTDFDLQIFYSPGDLIANESDSDYQSLRRQAKNRWIYGRGSLRSILRLRRGYTLNLWLQGQYSSADLLPSEQFGIGGYATVRGYDERQLNMDNAFLSSLEVRSPLIPIVSMIRCDRVKDALQFLAFIDYGWGQNRNLLEGEPIQDYLLGAGPGFRYTLDPYIAVRLDWGIKLHKQAIFTGHDSQVHFSGTFSY